MKKPFPGFPSPFCHSTRATRRRDRWRAILGYSAGIAAAAAYYVIICLAFA